MSALVCSVPLLVVDGVSFSILRVITTSSLTTISLVYITSTDDHDWHDIFMIAYLLLTLPWTIGGILLSREGTKSLKYRKIFGISFFLMIIPLVYFFIQHKVNHIPGGLSFRSFRLSKLWSNIVYIIAYTIYAFFEWSLIFFDVAYDSVTALDFKAFEIRVVDMNGITNGYVPTFPV